MTFETATLSLALLGTNALWAYQTHRLINKMMARNYHDYQVTLQRAPAVEKADPMGEFKIPLDESLIEDLQPIGDFRL